MGAAEIQVERSFLLRVDVDHLESRIVRAAVELPIHPLDALLRVVLRVRKEVIQLATAEGLHHAVIASSLGMVEVSSDQAGQFLKAGVVHRYRLVRQILALAPVGQ